MNKPTMRQVMQVLAILDMDEILGPLPHQYVKATVEVALTKLYAEFECAAIAQTLRKDPVKTPEEKTEHTIKVYAAIVHSKDFKYIGCFQDFGQVQPKEYRDCWNAGHFHDGTIQNERSEDGLPWKGTIHTCPKCKIYWKNRAE